MEFSWGIGNIKGVSIWYIFINIEKGSGINNSKNRFIEPCFHFIIKNNLRKRRRVSPSSTLIAFMGVVIGTPKQIRKAVWW